MHAKDQSLIVVGPLFVMFKVIAAHLAFESGTVGDGGGFHFIGTK